MKVFLTGATGVAGRATVPALIAAGHDVRAVCRRDDAAERLRAAGAEPVAVDLFDAEAVAGAVAGCDAIVHLATNVPPLSKAGRTHSWDLHNRLRVEATRHLVAAGRRAGVVRFVKESITFVYRDAGDAWIDESSPLLPDLGLLASTIVGEDAALEFAAGGGTAAVLRFGLFYGGEGNRGTDEALRLARLRRSTIAGPAAAYMSSIHCDDVATAVVGALTVPTGVYNVVDDEPLTRGEYLRAFGEALGVKSPKPTPARLLTMLGGSGAAGLVASQRVANGRFREATGWSPRFPSARAGWAAVAATRVGVSS
ncbi:MAG: NAD-dependent epimerase/dehydratase family protein [Acidimicrobiia bacterium]